MKKNAWMHDFREGMPSETEAGPDAIGPKAKSLMEMGALGLSVPAGFVLTTGACAEFLEGETGWPEGFAASFRTRLEGLEGATGRAIGDGDTPLLFAVRSGAMASMPGMRGTVLNVGLNEANVETWAASSEDPAFVYDTYRRAIEMYGDVVLGIHPSRFLQATQACLGPDPSEVEAETLKSLCASLLEVIREHGSEVPEDPVEQVLRAVEALFLAHNSHRARYFRKAHGIQEGEGTPVVVQAMVFGHRAEASGSGVVFTRNPSDGEPGLFGEWRARAQGSDLTLTPGEGGAGRCGESQDVRDLEQSQPQLYQELVRVQGVLEAHYRDMQEVAFTVEEGKLHLLHSRSGQRTAQAAVKIVVDLVESGALDKSEALGRVEPESLEMLMRPVIHPDAKRKVIATGLGASPGAAYGKVVFEASDCQAHLDRDEPTILVRRDTSPEDIQGIMLAQGVLTARGGQTSHAAVVARGMGKPCVVGCTDIHVDYTRGLFYAGDTVVQEGDWITIDGTTGDVLEGQVEMLTSSSESGEMHVLLGWADEVARMAVRANVDTGSDAQRARDLGVVGIGLCRTEHMFFGQDELRAIRKLILADDPRARQRAIHEIIPAQRAVFAEMFKVMDGFPVTIRLLDPPLQNFLPQREADLLEVAVDLGVNPDRMRERLMQLKESNPVLGHRGVRLGVTSPEIYQAQVRAVMEAACTCAKEGLSVQPEIMVPLVGMTAELEQVRERVQETVEAVLAEYEQAIPYSIGTMIEVPRAALIADRLAHYADFFSFGTNDLTQLMYGWSRDDAGKFLVHYQREGLLAESPLTRLDQDGVGEILKVAVERGKEGNPRLLLGVCGEHGGDPHAIGFFHRLGLDYVSCSPYRVPVARLAAAHAALGLL